MRAAVMHGTGPEALVDLRDDVVTIGPGPREVKVRMRATGVCHSDLSVLYRRHPVRHAGRARA